MAGILTWVTVALGSIAGIVALCLGGCSKLFPFHPKNKAMSYGFDKVWGPFIGCPGMPLRLIIGLGELLAGLGLLVGLWGDALGYYDKALSDTSKALVISAGVALFICWSVAAMVHKYVDGSPGMPAGLSVLTLIMTLLRMFFIGPDYRANQIVATVLSCLIMIGVIIALLINRAKGLNETIVEEENKKLHEMM
eukprot:CAMPEP_0204532496 /NCGR_PEP_ID=MMETSP0661-20131031/11759_1 /ASSEMBLY_ACC=CAM_ASM_000606 /TAXON_ID=109239 /ORGANISM="Alexandrium margalefi, Strain AMGDE01CS-322" /LENGTH=193 /DNA_ID=CAMNT_0051538745 /DNA_START=77 /DNA_END=658 /DNA_ORIENTATION=+